MRNFFILLTIFTLAATVFADGFAYSKGSGIINKIQETHQIAVINLKPGQADVSMYIGITDIPAGQSITYILPFWYRPDNFTMTEENSNEKFTKILTPLNNKISELNKKYTTNFSEPLENAWKSVLYINPPFYFSGNAKARQGTAGVYYDPFQTITTPHAKAMLYKIGTGGNDLQQLIKQSGLPDKLLIPLKKYNTQYFAVMQLTGIKKDNKSAFGKGIMYSFSHKITDNKYTYPLGTGAAWSKPIPLTEVFITCPDNMKLNVIAPQYGDKENARNFSMFFNDYLRIIKSNKENFDSYFNDIKQYQMSFSNILENNRDSSIWQIKYFMTNPDTDITATFSNRQFSIISVIDFLFLNDIAPWILIVICFFFSWFVTFKIIIQPYCRKNPELNPIKTFINTIIITSCELLTLIYFLYSLPLLTLMTEIFAETALGLLLVIFAAIPVSFIYLLLKIAQHRKSADKLFIFQQDHDFIRIKCIILTYITFAISTSCFAGLYDLI